MLFEQDLQLEEKLHAICSGRGAPGRKGGVRGLDGGVHFCGRPGRRMSERLSGCGVQKFNAGGTCGGDPLAADEVVNRGGSESCHGTSM